MQEIGDQEKAGEERDHNLGRLALDALPIAGFVAVDGLAVGVELIAEALLFSERHLLEGAFGPLTGDAFVNGLRELCDVIDHGCSLPIIS